MFVKRDCLGGIGQRVGDFFCKCKINEHALDTKSSWFPLPFLQLPPFSHNCGSLLKWRMTEHHSQKDLWCHLIPPLPPLPLLVEIHFSRGRSLPWSYSILELGLSGSPPRMVLLPNQPLRSLVLAGLCPRSLIMLGTKDCGRLADFMGGYQ